MKHHTRAAAWSILHIKYIYIDCGICLWRMHSAQMSTMTFMHYWLNMRKWTEIRTYGVRYSFNWSTSDIVGTIVAIAFDFKLLPIDMSTNHSLVKLSKSKSRKRQYLLINYWTTATNTHASQRNAQRHKWEWVHWDVITWMILRILRTWSWRWEMGKWENGETQIVLRDSSKWPNFQNRKDWNVPRFKWVRQVKWLSTNWVEIKSTEHHL